MKSVFNIPPHLRSIPYLESQLREEEALVGRKKSPCECSFRQLTRTGICSECIKGILQSLRDGVGNTSTKYIPSEGPVPDGIPSRGCPEQKRNLGNKA